RDVVACLRCSACRTMQDERGHADRRQDVAEIRLRACEVQRVRGGRTCADAELVCEPGSARLAGVKRGADVCEELVAELTRAPIVSQARELGELLVARPEVCPRLKEDERPHPLRIGGSIER